MREEEGEVRKKGEGMKRKGRDGKDRVRKKGSGMRREGRGRNKGEIKEG